MLICLECGKTYQDGLEWCPACCATRDRSVVRSPLTRARNTRARALAAEEERDRRSAAVDWAVEDNLREKED